MKKLIIAIATMLSVSARAQDTTKQKPAVQPTEKLYYFAFPANYVDALYNSIGVAAENNKSGVSISELKQAVYYQANNQPVAPALVKDTMPKLATQGKVLKVSNGQPKKTKKHGGK